MLADSPAGLGVSQRMLLELRAEKYTVIDRAQVQFGPGLNLLTGETGAGKSILIDALVLLLGAKASADVVRHGEERAVLSCSFEATDRAVAVLAEHGIDAEEETILLRREITTAGKGRVFINNQASTVAVLRQLAPELALVHAQGETTAAVDAAQQRASLDRFSGAGMDAVAAAYGVWQGASRELAELEDASSDRLRMTDLWRFQAGEIADAGIVDAEEDARLEAEKRVLANADRLYAAAMGAHELLYEAESSAESTLGAALKQVEELARFEPRFAESVAQLAAARAAVEDVDAELRHFADTVQGSPERLAEIEDRLAALDRLKRKYGATLGAVMAFGEDVTAKLGAIENRDERLAELRVERERAAASYRAAAEKLSKARTAAAKDLSKRAEAEINELAMRVRFAIEVRPRAEDERGWAATGWDEIEFLIATNRGEPMKPLDEIASGGEMSRVMLALKVAVEARVRERSGDAMQVRSLIFDEIDVGIGGSAAEAVGQRLKALARGQQVLCITHLPQIAAFADQHFLIAKKEQGERTETSIQRLDDGERRAEIARMLSGAKLTETSLRHAEHLLAAHR